MIDEIRLAESSVWYTEQSEKEDVYCEGWNDCNRDWMQRIEKMPKVGEWIPCSERLPEDIKTVLVTIEESKEPMLGWYGNKFGWRIVAAEFANIKDFTVLAWMPLPELYKEETK